MKKIVLCMALVISAFAMQAASYVQLTATSQLQAGDTLVWVNKANLKGNTSIAGNSKYMEVAAVELIGQDTIVSTELRPMVLGGSAGAWTFTYANGTKIGRVNNDTKFSTSANLTYTIEIGADSNAVISSASAATYKIFYNPQSPRFAFYTSNTMAPVQLFKKLPAGQGPNIKVQGVTLSTETLSLRAGDADTLTATVTPQDAKNKNVSWGSTNEDVATVKDGVVSALVKGETKIWVRTVDGDFTDTCYVQVNASLHQPDVTWNRLQSLDSLKEGTRVFFASVKQSENYVMGVYDYDVAKANIPGAAATFSNDYHSVTASESYAYTVSIENGKYIFRDLDGSYLCDYNQKNLSAQDNLDNKARWTGTMNEYFEFLFTNTYNTGYVIYNNHNSDMFCCYNAFDKSNMARIALFSDNAPEWVEPIREPELTILVDKDTVTDVLDFGEVVYDDTWGTEVNPYEASKTLSFVAKDLTDSIRLSVNKGTVFTLYTRVLRPQGGTASVQFSTDKKGSYTDTLYITCDTIVRKIVLTVKAVTEEEVKPSLILSTQAISMHINLQEEYMADAEMTFSVKNLKKNLYIKWEKGTIPSAAGESATIIVGNDAVEIPFGGAPSFGTDTRTDEDILLEAVAYSEGTYTSTLCFYTPDELDKSKNAFEQRVTITIVADYEQPTSLDSYTIHPTPYTKIIKNNHLLIYRYGKWYMVNGQIVNE